MNAPTLSIVPIRSALLADHDTVTHALIRVTAPDAPAEAPRRAPLHVALVIDRSGSMGGQPIEQAKRCAAFVVAGLTPKDRASLVTYDDKINVLVPADEIGNGDSIHRAIATVRSGGSTDLHGGWCRGAETLAPHAAPRVLSRVILLSDGCANAGLTDAAAIAKQCADLAETGVTTSTYGLGSNFNESLMHAMARNGRGNAYYGATADDLMDPFREELALLNALMARRLTLHLEPSEGVMIEVLNDYPSAGTQTWKLPDLAYGAEAWAMVQIRVPRTLTEQARDQHIPLLTARVACIDLEGHSLELAPVSLALPSVATATFEALAEDELVGRRLRELKTARVADKAREAARVGDWGSVDQQLKDLRKAVKDSPWLTTVVKELEALAAQRDEMQFSKEALYSTSRMSTRLSSVNEDLNPALEIVPDFLRRKSAQGKAAPPRSNAPKST